MERPAKIVVLTLVDSLRGAFWDGRAVAPRWADIAGLDRGVGRVRAGVLIAVARAHTWAQRLQRGPWRDPLDVVVVAFWGTVLAHFVTWFGTSTVLRYELTFQESCRCSARSR